jgi:hypothetical protein
MAADDEKMSLSPYNIETTGKGGFRPESMMCMFPEGYNWGDIYKDIISQATGYDKENPTEWFQQWMPIDEDRFTNRFYQCMHESDPLWYKDCSYKDFFGEGEQDALFEALNSGNEDYVRKAFQLRPGQDGLYINLNTGCGHPGFKGHPEDKRFLPKPPMKDTSRRKIGDKGAALLGSCLPRRGVRSLIIQLARNDIGVEGGKALARGIPEDVEDLKIFINGNEIRNQGCIALAQKIQKLKGLESLTLGLGSNLITDQGNTMLAECLPESLQRFHCMMRWNTFRDENVPAREKMWQVADTLPFITNKEDASQWWLLY